MNHYKVVLVTGASAGFGYEICRLLAKNGFLVIATARRKERLNELAKEYPDSIFPYALDVRDNDSIRNLIESLPEKLSSIDILVNNAGLALGVEKAQNSSLENWKTMIDTNILGVVQMTKAVLPIMITRNCGYIINIGSIAGSLPYIGSTVYGASKAFVEQFSKNLRCDTAGTAIKVTVIKPGLCQDTEFSYVRLNGDKEKVAPIYANTQSILPEDIASTVLWLAKGPMHLNINEIEMMPVCQTYGGPSVTRNVSFDLTDKD
ncbi:MAG: SDR family NAD(P)-dependent oxidoreductase [Aeromonadales bacterium]|nr:SDR family NAD(P)-dependent oxidoreductase [Aeromonadales bacterium]